MKKEKYWPIGITVFLIFFVLANVGFLIFALGIDTDLVSENYYEDELAYQQQIDRIQNAKRLSEPLRIDFEESGFLSLQFPKEMPTTEISGTIVLFRPDDKRRDNRIPIRVDENRRQFVDMSGLKKGNWNIKVFWNNNTEKYYNEAPVFVK